MMKRKVVRLTESQLGKIVKESVKNVMNEINGELRDSGKEQKDAYARAFDSIFEKTSEIFW